MLGLMPVNKIRRAVFVEAPVGFFMGTNELDLQSDKAPYRHRPTPPLQLRQGCLMQRRSNWLDTFFTPRWLKMNTITCRCKTKRILPQMLQPPSSFRCPDRRADRALEISMQNHRGMVQRGINGRRDPDLLEKNGSRGPCDVPQVIRRTVK